MLASYPYETCYFVFCTVYIFISTLQLHVTGVSNARGSMKKSRFSTNFDFRLYLGTDAR